MRRRLGGVYFGPALLSLAVLLLSQPLKAAFSSSDAGSAGAQFLSLGPDARALGLGEAMASAPDGAWSLYWNPAGLASLSQSIAALSDTQLFSDFYYNSLAYGRPVPALKGSLAASFNILNESPITAVTNAGQSLPGSFSPYSADLSLGYGRKINDFLDAGLALKGIKENLYDESAYAAAMDAGAIYHPESVGGLSLGLTARNFGTKEKFYAQSSPLPFEIDTGASYHFNNFLLASDLALPYYGRAYGKFGLEYVVALGKDLSGAVRCGYKTLVVPDLNALSGLTAGAGLSMKRFSADFGFEPMQDLGEVYRFSLGYKLR